MLDGAVFTRPPRAKKNTALFIAGSIMGEGAEVTLTSRLLDRAETAFEAMRRRFKVELTPAATGDPASLSEVVNRANILLATGAAGVQLIHNAEWQSVAELELLLDANATPPLGIEGVDMMDRATERHGKICYGAIGFGSFKLEVHRACISQLFESNSRDLDAPEIFALAKSMVEGRA